MNREIPISVLSEEMNREIPEVSSQDAFLTPARSSEPLAEKNIFLTPQTKIMEDSSSLGRFTAFVPIVRKKGTEKEEVLTPVRRFRQERAEQFCWLRNGGERVTIFCWGRLRGICPSRTRKVSDFDARSRAKYDSSTRASPQWDSFSWETERPSSRQPKEEEEFYGLEDFFRDLQAVGSKMEKQDAKPKSLWEELAEIGEEFVEFLEKELNITDSSEGDKSAKYRPDFDTRNTKNKASYESNIPEEEKEKKRVESEIAEIEEMLAKIKKEMGI
ncbi:hypothetical protein R1sor_008026 [Riccia sorocarpa]|uniref:Uncharacterized protein n=1 Tax=Riccia sorocarpa TaxID=122646 RepID=A0ABD3HVS5_9MARC